MYDDNKADTCKTKQRKDNNNIPDSQPGYLYETTYRHSIEKYAKVARRLETRKPLKNPF